MVNFNAIGTAGAPAFSRHHSTALGGQPARQDSVTGDSILPTDGMRRAPAAPTMSQSAPLRDILILACGLWAFALVEMPVTWHPGDYRVLPPNRFNN